LITLALGNTNNLTEIENAKAKEHHHLDARTQIKRKIIKGNRVKS
jgi:hypothetical protein